MAAIELPIKLQGMHGSPYTRKMLALLRYRRLPYRFIVDFPQNPKLPGNGPERASLPIPKVPLLPTFYFKDDNGTIEAATDSTPIIRRLEQAFSERSVIPSHPVSSFINYLIEDYADEWLTRCMFHYRWSRQKDIDKAATMLPLSGRVDLTEQELKNLAQHFAERQIGRLQVVGSNETTAPVIEASYRRFLKLMEAHLSQAQFLFGSRPASADLALMGQLTSLSHFDPTPSQLCEQYAPRVYAWVDWLEDLSGYEIEENAWNPATDLPNTVVDILAEIAQTHMPQILANGRAVLAGEKRFETEIGGLAWEQPSFPYQLKCLNWTREAFAVLSDQDQLAVRNILKTAGLLPIIDEAIS